MGKADFLLGTCRERIVLFNGDVGAEDDNHDMTVSFGNLEGGTGLVVG